MLINNNVKTKIDKTYIVSIVTDMTLSQASENPSINQEVAPSKQKETMSPQPVVKETVRREPAKKDDDKIVQDRISEMIAKKRIEKLVATRSNIDLASSSKSSPIATNKRGSSTQGQSKGDYLSLVRAKIMERWVYPETIDKDLEAIITIKIKKDGTVQLIGIEKSSGNRLFDRTALSAISSIQNLPSPPEGIEELGIRFKP
ncbi:MAG TPA: TonB family protein [Nitrospirae bacterium]|nr:TonB family protein [Nitrospirota bacterium]